MKLLNGKGLFSGCFPVPKMLLLCFKGETVSIGDSSLSSRANLARGVIGVFGCFDLAGDVACQSGELKCFLPEVGDVISLTPAAKLSLTFESIDTLFGDLTLTFVFRRIKGFGTGASSSDSVN